MLNSGCLTNIFSILANVNKDTRGHLFSSFVYVTYEDQGTQHKVFMQWRLRLSQRSSSLGRRNSGTMEKEVGSDGGGWLEDCSRIRQAGSGIGLCPGTGKVTVAT